MKKLYKYQKISDYSISALVNEYCWSSNPSDFNDPFDTKIIDSELLQKINFSKEKIFCLSEINDNFLMWSHYADSHKGICLEFTDYTNKELAELKEKGIYPKIDNDKLLIIRNAKKVVYKSSKQIEEYIKDIPTDDTFFLKEFKKLNLTKQRELTNKIQSTSFIKHKDWQYEKEYRLVNITDNINRFPGKLTAIYFGMKMLEFNKRMIGKILNPNWESDILFYQMYREKGEYSLSSRLFNIDDDLKGINDLIVYDK